MWYHVILSKSEIRKTSLFLLYSTIHIGKIFKLEKKFVLLFNTFKHKNNNSTGSGGVFDNKMIIDEDTCRHLN